MSEQRTELQKAIELGKALSDSRELLRLRKAQAELRLDKEADMLYRQLQTSNSKTRNKREGGTEDATQPDFEEKVRNNSIINELISAQKEFNKLMKDINGIIGFYVTGKENIELKRGSCSQCNGCKN